MGSRNNYLIKAPCNRMDILKYIIVIVLLDCIVGVLIGRLFILYNVNMKFILITTLFCITVFLLLLSPLLISNEQFCALEDDGISYLPTFDYIKKVRILLYIVVKNTMDPFIKKVSFTDIISGELTFSKYRGKNTITCYLYHIKLETKQGLINLYINPIENSAQYSSDRNGLYMRGLKTKEEVLSVLQHFSSNNIHLVDKYMIEKALEADDIEIDRYLKYCHQRTRL